MYFKNYATTIEQQRTLRYLMVTRVCRDGGHNQVRYRVPDRRALAEAVDLTIRQYYSIPTIALQPFVYHLNCILNLIPRSRFNHERATGTTAACKFNIDIETMSEDYGRPLISTNHHL